MPDVFFSSNIFEHVGRKPDESSKKQVMALVSLRNHIHIELICSSTWVYEGSVIAAGIMIRDNRLP